MKKAEVLEQYLVKHLPREMSDREMHNAALCLAFWEYAGRLRETYGEAPNNRVDRHILNFLPRNAVNRFGNTVRESYFALFRGLAESDSPQSLLSLRDLYAPRFLGHPVEMQEIALGYARMCYAILKWQPESYPLLCKAGGEIQSEVDPRHGMKALWWSLDTRYWLAPNFTAAIRRNYAELLTMAHRTAEASKPLGSLGDLAALKERPAGISPILRGIKEKAAGLVATVLGGAAKPAEPAPVKPPQTPQGAPKPSEGENTRMTAETPAKGPASAENAAAPKAAAKPTAQGEGAAASESALLDFTTLETLTASLKELFRRRNFKVIEMAVALRARLLKTIREEGELTAVKATAERLGIKQRTLYVALVNLYTMGLLSREMRDGFLRYRLNEAGAVPEKRLSLQAKLRILSVLAEAAEPLSIEAVVERFSARFGKIYTRQHISNTLADLKREGKAESSRRGHKAVYRISDAGRLKLVDCYKGIAPPPLFGEAKAESAPVEPPKAAEAVASAEAPAATETPVAETGNSETLSGDLAALLETTAVSIPEEPETAAETAAPKPPVGAKAAALRERLMTLFELVADEFAAIVAEIGKEETK